MPWRPGELAENVSFQGGNENAEGLFIGDHGKIFWGFKGENPRLIPKEKARSFVPPPKALPRFPRASGGGHRMRSFLRPYPRKLYDGYNFRVIDSAQFIAHARALKARQILYFCSSAPALFSPSTGYRLLGIFYTLPIFSVRVLRRRSNHLRAGCNIRL
jgi:hypothetical protein